MLATNLFYFFFKKRLNSWTTHDWLVATTYCLEMLSIELTTQPTVPTLPRQGASARKGQVPLFSFSFLISQDAGLAHLQACLVLQQSLSLLTSCPLACWRWWLSCLLFRNPWHWILLSNLAPCLYCDEWGWADDKQRSLGRRSNTTSGLPGAYLWLCRFGKFHPW